MTFYPDAHLTDVGITLDDGEGTVVTIPAHWIEANPRLRSESGFFHRITLTAFVNEIHIAKEIQFE